MAILVRGHGVRHHVALPKMGKASTTMTNEQQFLPVPTDSLPEVRFEERFRQASAFVKGAITILSDLVAANQDDLVGVAHADVLVSTMRRDLSLLDDEMQKVMWQAMGEEKETTIEGVGVLKKDYGRKLSKWDHETIWSKMRIELRTAFTDPETGELDNEKMAVVQETINLVRSVIAQGTYKTSGIAKLGLELNDVADTGWGRKKVVIMGASK